MSQLTLPVGDIPEALRARIEQLSRACRMIEGETDQIQRQLALYGRHLPDDRQLTLRILRAALFNLEFILDPRKLTNAQDSAGWLDHANEQPAANPSPKDGREATDLELPRGVP